MANLAGLFGCKIESIPFTYLGLPLGITRPKIRDYAPFINHIDRRLASCSSFMSLLVAKAVITALPTFYTGVPQTSLMVSKTLLIYLEEFVSAVNLNSPIDLRLWQPGLVFAAPNAMGFLVLSTPLSE